MKCVVFLVATAFVCQAVIGSPRPYRSSYSHRGHHDSSAGGDPSIHSHWWHGAYKPSRPGHYGSSGSDESSQEVNYSSNSNPGQGTGYGSKGGGDNGVMTPLAPWPSPTSEEPIYKPNPLSSGTDLNEQDVIKACIETCSVTTEYNPVCGSNNVTYPNPGRLECEQNCGVDVQLSGLTACLVYETINTQRNPNKSREEVVACIRQCPATAEYNPVCGSNNVTYANPGRLECEQACGILVQLVKLTACIPDPITTPKLPTQEEVTADCLRYCPVSGEFNPVCGSDNVTYSNPGKLECAQICGIDVQFSRPTSCGAPPTEAETKNTNPETITNSTGRPFTNQNVENNVGDQNNGNTQNNSNGEVNLSGGSNTGSNSNGGNVFNAGNNDNGEFVSHGEIDGNYENTGNIFNGGNNENSVNQGKGGYHSGAGTSGYGGNQYVGNQFNGGHGGNHGNYPANNCNEINTNNNKRMPSVKELLQCMQLCALTSESIPVCGTDDITYMNPGRLLCAQFCGIDVRVKKFAACTSTTCSCHHCATPCTNPVTNNPEEVTPSPHKIRACMKACPTSQVFRPVCGTNKITYKNLEKLQCARQCGIDVSLLKETHCSTADPSPTDGNPPVWGSSEKPSLQECIRMCPVNEKYEPICGTDNVNYNNTGHLLCARQCGLDVRVKMQSLCSSTNPDYGQVSPGTTGSNITISPDVIASIWNVTETGTDDESFDLDQRVQDSK